MCIVLCVYVFRWRTITSRVYMIISSELIYFINSSSRSQLNVNLCRPCMIGIIFIISVFFHIYHTLFLCIKKYVLFVYLLKLCKWNINLYFTIIFDKSSIQVVWFEFALKYIFHKSYIQKTIEVFYLNNNLHSIYILLSLFFSGLSSFFVALLKPLPYSKF